MLHDQFSLTAGIRALQYLMAKFSLRLQMFQVVHLSSSRTIQATRQLNALKAFLITSKNIQWGLASKLHEILIESHCGHRLVSKMVRK